MISAIRTRRPLSKTEIIDRNTRFAFSFNGTLYTAFHGDTIASALAAADVKVLSRSFKYHRPRGLLCCSGHCPNCLVQIGSEPNVRACRRQVEAGMEVRVQNAWPSLDHDLMSVTQFAERFLPVGFYYKTFMRPQMLWPLYEHMLRHAAGLGEVSPDMVPGEFDKQFLHVDVVVIGAGPSGMSAALAAGGQGARVLLVDENPALGGHLRFSTGQEQNVASQRAALDQQDNITIYTDTSVLGWYEHNWLAAVRGRRLFKIRTRALVVASGAHEAPLVFDNNDLPGVLLGSAVQRLLHLYSVVPGKRGAIVTANDDGWTVAADLQDAGAELAAIVDARPRDSCTSPHVDALTAAFPIFWGHTIVGAKGSRSVTGAHIAPVDAKGGVDESRARAVDCDLIAISVGWTPASELLYQAGGKFAYHDERAEILPVDLPPGVYGAGRVNGTHGVENQVAEGRLAGLSAAAFLGLCSASSAGRQSSLAARRAAEPLRTWPFVRVPGRKKRFVCYCEDVTDVDIETAIAEGYDNIELLKRYSTTSMGPCQGKMCSMNTIHLCAVANDATVDGTGTTTARPPSTPVLLGALAGQNMEPVRVTPVHEWHLARDAKMMVAGLWVRPEHYGDPIAEVRAVRERVGLIDVSTLGKLRLTGSGVPDLLERLYVNRWRKLGVERVRYGVMCNDEGVVMDDGVCAHMATEEWYMTTTSGGSSEIFEWIQWWAQSGWGEGVHVVNRTEDFAAFNLAGSQARALLQKLVAGDIDLSNQSFPYMHVRTAQLAGMPCHLLRIGFTGELSYEIHCPAAYGQNLWETLLAAGEEFGIAPFGVEAQRVLRLEKAHILVGQDTDALSDPISADMAWAVKLDKADFLGQRSLVRVAEAGPQQRLVGFKLAREGLVPEEGLQIVAPAADGGLEIIGWVTSCRHSPTLGETIGLCWLRADLAEHGGASFTIRMNGNLVEGRVQHGAFYDPEGKRLRM